MLPELPCPRKPAAQSLLCCCMMRGMARPHPKAPSDKADSHSAEHGGAVHRVDECCGQPMGTPSQGVGCELRCIFLAAWQIQRTDVTLQQATQHFLLLVSGGEVPCCTVAW